MLTRCASLTDRIAEQIEILAYQAANEHHRQYAGSTSNS
jgi:hypothetical protein